MPTLYDDPFSRNGYKIRLLLSHLKLSFKSVRLDIMKGETRQPGFLAKNVAGRIPALELDDGTMLAESGAILFYLAEGTPLLPEDRLGRAQVLRWMFFEQNMIESTIGTRRFYVRTGRDQERPDAFKQRGEVVLDALQAMERHLADGRGWLACQRFTIADIAVYGYLSVAEEAALDMSPYPNILAWRKRVESLPGHVAWDWGI
jgi:glutathione S-transferase